MQDLIQIEMLKTIEEMTGKSISELFDWVVGTSTGGNTGTDGQLYVSTRNCQLGCCKHNIIPRSAMCFLSHHGNPVLCMILHSIIDTIIARIDQFISLENNVQVSSLWRT